MSSCGFSRMSSRTAKPLPSQRIRRPRVVLALFASRCIARSLVDRRKTKRTQAKRYSYCESPATDPTGPHFQMTSDRTYRLLLRDAVVRSISSPDHSNGIQVCTELNRESGETRWSFSLHPVCRKLICLSTSSYSDCLIWLTDATCISTRSEQIQPPEQRILLAAGCHNLREPIHLGGQHRNELRTISTEA